MGRLTVVMKSVGYHSIIIYPQQIHEDNIFYSLHVFADASPQYYGTMCYLFDGVQKPYLLTACARVMPMKKRTLLHLVLTAILIGCKLTKYILDTLRKISINKIYTCSDRKIVLQWVIN